MPIKINMICSISQCKNGIRFKCFCKGAAIYICQSHSSDHCRDQGKHQLISMCTKLEQKINKNFMQKFYEKNNFLSAIKTKLLSEVTELMNFILQNHLSALQKFESEEERILNALEMAQKEEEVYIKDYSEYLKEENYDFSIDFNFFNSKLLRQEIMQYYSQDFLSTIKLIPSENKTITKSMVYFLRKTKSMININIKDMSLKKIEYQLEESMGSHAG